MWYPNQWFKIQTPKYQTFTKTPNNGDGWGMVILSYSQQIDDNQTNVHNIHSWEWYFGVWFILVWTTEKLKSSLIFLEPFAVSASGQLLVKHCASFPLRTCWFPGAPVSTMDALKLGYFHWEKHGKTSSFETLRNLEPEMPRSFYLEYI